MKVSIAKALVCLPLVLGLAGCSVLQDTAEIAVGTVEAAGNVVLWTADMASLGLISSATGSKDSGWAASPADTLAVAGGAAGAYAMSQSNPGHAYSAEPMPVSGGSGVEGAASSFQSRELRDFHIQSASEEVQVCVWDHECVDGDELRVSINDTSYDVKLNGGDRPDCRELRLASGRNRISINALNGTGYLGNCSHDNVNTGTIAIGGVRASSFQEQTWSIRGGAGSQASIYLDVQ